MMRMSPQTVGLITCYFMMTVLTICILPTEIQHVHPQPPSTVFLILQRFRPFINNSKPTLKPLATKKYLSVSPGYKKHFIYAKKIFFPGEQPLKTNVSTKDFKEVAKNPLILFLASTNQTLSKSKAKFPYPREVGLFSVSGNNTKNLHHSDSQNTDEHISNVLAHSYINATGEITPDDISVNNVHSSDNTEHEDMHISQNKTSHRQKNYFPVFNRVDVPRTNGEIKNKVHRSSVAPNDNEVNFHEYKEISKTLPLQSNKHQPFLKAWVYIRPTVPLSEPNSGIISPESSNEAGAIRLGKELQELFLGNLGISFKNNTESGGCVLLQNLCTTVFGQSTGRNLCQLLYGKANVTDEFKKVLVDEMKDFGQPCQIIKNSLSDFRPGNISGQIFIKTQDLRPNHLVRYRSPMSNQRKSRMLEELKSDVTVSIYDRGEDVGTTVPYMPYNGTDFPDSEITSYLPNNDTPHNTLVIAKRNGNVVTEAAHSELFTKIAPLQNATISNIHVTTNSLANTQETDFVNVSSSTEIVPGTLPFRLPLAPKQSLDETVSLENRMRNGLTTFRDVILRITSAGDGNRTGVSSFEGDDQQPRQGKMTDIHGTREKAAEKSTNYYSSGYYADDYDYESLDHEDSQNIGVYVPEFKPGSLTNFSVTFRRQPVKQKNAWDNRGTTKISEVKPRYYFFESKKKSAANATTMATTFADGARVIGSTFFPNRVHKTSLQFGRRKLNSTTEDSSTKEDTEPRTSDSDEDDDEDGEDEPITHEFGFTMEKLAYLLIGTCCCLSVICLLAVVGAIKCRRLIIERRLRNRLFRHNLYHNSSAPWQHHFYDQFMYLNGHPTGSSSSRASCNCRCVTWSLGARNLDTRPICPTRSSIYLTGPKTLPFGAASTLCYETMIHTGRRNSTPRPPRPPPRVSSKSEESSQENDSLDPNSDPDNAPGHERRRCTCIDPSWAMGDESLSSVYDSCPKPKPNRRKSRCPRGSASGPDAGVSTLDSACPPPVRGSDYLDRTDGVVYWSSNDERLI